jgi:hypothetical protein
MALDPRIALAAGQQGVDLTGSLLKGLQLSQQIRRAPILEEMEKARLAQAQLQLEQAQQGGEQLPLRSFAPVPGVGPEGEQALLIPTVDPRTGQTTLQPAQLPEGFELTQDTGQSEVDQQIRLAKERANIELDKQKELQALGVKGAEQKEVAKLLAGERSEIRKSFRQKRLVADDTIRVGNKLKKGLQDLKTGRVAAARQSLGAFIPGIRDANAEAFIALTNNFILEQAQKLTGVLSDTDIQLLRSTGPQLGNTLEGNIQIIDNILEASKHARGQDKKFRTFLKRGGNAEEFELESKNFISGPQQQQEGPQVLDKQFEGFKIIR